MNCAWEAVAGAGLVNCVWEAVTGAGERGLCLDSTQPQTRNLSDSNKINDVRHVKPGQVYTEVNEGGGRKKSDSVKQVVSDSNNLNDIRHVKPEHVYTDVNEGDGCKKSDNIKHDTNQTNNMWEVVTGFIDYKDYLNPNNQALGTDSMLKEGDGYVGCGGLQQNSNDKINTWGVVAGNDDYKTNSRINNQISVPIKTCNGEYDEMDACGMGAYKGMVVECIDYNTNSFCEYNVAGADKC